MAGFKFRYSLAPGSDESVRQYVIANSATIAEGDVVLLSSGYLSPGTATNRLVGVVEGIVDANGVPLDHPEADHDGTWTNSPNTYVASSDNQTDKQVRALVRTDPLAVYSATPDATIGTTTGSNLQGYYCDIASETAPDESGASTSAAQLCIHGLDPDDSSKGLYSIAEHQFHR